MGFNILADLQMLGLEYQYTALATTREFIKARPDVVRSVVKASVEAIHYLKTHRQETLEILRKYMKIDDTDALVEAYEAIGLTLLLEKPYPTMRGIQIMLLEMAGKDRKAKAAKAQQFVHTTFVKELDASGYIDGLYKTTPVLAKGEARPPRPPTGVEQRGEPPAQKAQIGSKTQRAEEKLAQNSKPSSASEEYSIIAGDTLSRLALRYYGDSLQWRRIYEANRSTIKIRITFILDRKL